MIGQSQELAEPTTKQFDYLNIIMMFEIGFGVAFQLPLVISLPGYSSPCSLQGYA